MMRRLRDVALQLDNNEFDVPYRSDFVFRSCYVCNYLSRRSRQLKLQADGVGIIAVEGSAEPAPNTFMWDRRAAIVPVHFARHEYDSISPGEEHEFLLAMLQAGFEKCAREHQIPLEALLRLVDEFRAGGYLNEWTHAKKRFRDYGIDVRLHCSLDPRRFRLRLEVVRGKRTLFDEVVLETQPDELIFAHRVRDVVVENGALIVRGDSGKQTFSIAVEELLGDHRA